MYCDEYPPAKSGGIGSVTKIVAEDLVLKGHNVIVFGSYEYGFNLPYFSIINGVKVYRLTHFKFLFFFPLFFRRFVKSIMRNIGLLSKIAKFDFIRNECILEQIIEIEKIECLELVDYMQLLSFVKEIIPFKKFKVPTTIRIHGSVSFLTISKGGMNKFQLKNDIVNFARTQKQTAVSTFSKQFVVDQLHQNEKSVTVIHNPIEANLIAESPNFDRITKNILFYGKITETKGAFQVIRAFNKLGEMYHDWNLVLIGGGEIQKAKSVLHPNLSSRVKFTGYLSREEVISAIDSAALCLIPSYFENFSMAPLEVMARGKSLIYTSMTSGPEIIQNGYNGILVNPYNVDEIIKSVSLLIEDEEYAKKMAKNGYDTVRENFTTHSINEELISHYNSLLRNWKKT